MSYAVDKFKAGDVHFEGLAAGWVVFPDEFRPLMTDAVMELYLAGLVDEDIVYATAQARQEHQEKILIQYIEDQTAKETTAEDIYDMQAAFGADADVTNVFTGEILHLAEY